MRLALCLILLPLAARASLADWHEYRTKHFVVFTDLSKQRAEPLVQKLETLHLLVLVAMVGEEVEIPGRLRAVAFSEPGTFQDLTGADVAGFFEFGRFGEPTIVFPVPGFSADPEVMAHEIAHHLSWYIYPRQPRWFSEGLAAFYQTVATEQHEERRPQLGSHLVAGESGGSHAVGFTPSGWKGAIEWARQVPLSQLLTWNGEEDNQRTGRFHFWSWVLYHYLWNNKSKQFSQFQQALGDAQDPDAAFRKAFPEYAAPEGQAALDETLRSYARDGRYSFYRVTGTGNAAATETKVNAGDARLLLWDVRTRWPSDPREAAALVRTETAQALEADPGNPLALSLQEQGKPGEPASVASRRAAAAGRPGDFRAWLLLGRALTAPDARAEQEAALRKAVQLNPDSAAAHNELAWALAGAGRAREALPVANRAADLAPWDPSVLDTLANVANQLGKCPVALALQRRAAALPGANDGIRKTLREYEGRCGAAKN